MKDEVVLPKDRVEFFRHFIKQYSDHLKKGEVEDSHHCAVAVLLELQKVLDDEWVDVNAIDWYEMDGVMFKCASRSYVE